MKQNYSILLTRSTLIVIMLALLVETVISAWLNSISYSLNSMYASTLCALIVLGMIGISFRTEKIISGIAMNISISLLSVAAIVVPYYLSVIGVLQMEIYAGWEMAIMFALLVLLALQFIVVLVLLISSHKKNSKRDMWAYNEIEGIKETLRDLCKETDFIEYSYSNPTSDNLNIPYVDMSTVICTEDVFEITCDNPFKPGEGAVEMLLDLNGESAKIIKTSCHGSSNIYTFVISRQYWFGEDREFLSIHIDFASNDSNHLITKKFLVGRRNKNFKVIS